MSLDAIALAHNEPACTWRLAASEKAARVAHAMPLVRVVVPGADRPDRRRQQLIDVLRHGMLNIAHESANSRAKEDRLGAPRSLYFHAGRTHPDYGTAVFVLRDPPATTIEASPFGLGALLCVQGGEDRDTSHGGCLAPPSHDGDTEQQAFYTANAWREAWRDRFAEFLAAYFGNGDLARYFAWDGGRPDLPGPRGIYQNAKQSDWRSWTVEVRVQGDVDLRAALVEQRIAAWGMSRECLNLVMDSSAAGEQFPFYEELRANAAAIEITLPNDAEESVPLLLREVDRRIQAGVSL